MRNYIFIALAAIALANAVTPSNAATVVRDHREPNRVGYHPQQPEIRDHRQSEVRDHRHS
jgi:hypothetical protein